MCSFCILLAFSTFFFAVQPSKVYFSGCQFLNGACCKSLETYKSVEVDLCLCLVDSRLLAKTAYWFVQYGKLMHVWIGVAVVIDCQKRCAFSEEKANAGLQIILEQYRKL